MPADPEHAPHGQTGGANRPILAMAGIRKSFPGVQAIRDASLTLRAGEIHALVGANGAGKSTLIKILTGAHTADAGSMILAGEPIRFRTPIEARRAGISAVYQEFSLVPTLSIHANLFLGRERTRASLIELRSEKNAAANVLKQLGLAIDPDAPIAELSPAQQQLVEIGRALIGRSRILILDEPTASLSPREADRLFQILRDLAGQGIAIVFISHRLEEVLLIANRVTVMRDGVTVSSTPISETSKAAMIEQMVGRPLAEEYPVRTSHAGSVCLRVERISGPGTFDVSFSVAHGEVLGLAGLVGAGRTELARLIFAADRAESGAIHLEGRRLAIRSPLDAIRNGICLLTEDRKAEGLILKASVKDNFAIANLRSWSRAGWIDGPREMARFQERTRQINLRYGGPDQRAEELSGGNQQKLLVARWLETQSRVIIFDEPTRGIDVGAKREMYQLIGNLAADGVAMIVISSEFPELLGLCDRILVMRGGRVAGEIVDVAHATQQDIMALAV